MSFIQDAFHAVIENAKKAETWYVALMLRTSRYGGPEEGGWWTSDTHLIEYKQFPSEELANAAKDAVELLSMELNEESHKEYGEQMLRSMEWLDERGLDADFLPEPDGEDEYYVVVSQDVPQESHGPTHYE